MMSETTLNTAIFTTLSTEGDSLRLLQAAVDELATRAMIEEAAVNAGAKAVPALLSLANDARSAGLAGAADIAEELALALAGPHSESQLTLLDGLAKIQLAMEKSAAESPSNDRGAGAPALGAIGEPPAWGSDPELLSDFFMESGDHLVSIEKELLTLEQDAANKDAVHSVFRSFHTIKGLAGFLGLPAMQEVAHEVETLLDFVRQDRLTVTPEIIDVVLASADHLKREIDRLQKLASGKPAGEPADHGPLLEVVRATRDGRDAGKQEHRRPSATREPAANPAAGVPAIPTAPAAKGAGSPLRELLEPAGRKRGMFAEPEHEPAAASGDIKPGDIKKSAVPESHLVKVDTGKLDLLVDMAGELAIAQSMIQHDGHLHAAGNPRLQRNLSQLARITAEVQKTTMAMRMVPIGQLFQKSVRLVRDLTRKSGKHAELEMSGEDTELDRTMVEQLADPLMHMIRNSADHGVESPEERAAAGKNPTARIHLKAYHRAGFIVVEVGDDGRGLNRQKILKKAVERGLVQEGEALSDKEVFNLIFEPGFSTAEVVTDVSGRGVGMDVVRKNLQKLRGRIDIESQPGKGSSFFLKLPLTLAIIDGLVVKTGGERYIIPIYAVRELFRPKAETRFTLEDREEMVLVRGNLLPVTRLYQRFGVVPRTTELHEGVLVVVETAAKSFCLMVDEVIGKQEVVIKNLGDTFKRPPGIAGGAILGDGRVGLILDMDTVLGEAAHV
jgi:two-component system chemotaxis sensor kinase CheA